VTLREAQTANVPTAPPASPGPEPAAAEQVTHAQPSFARRLLGSRAVTITTLLVVMFVLFATTQPNFLNYSNLMLLLINASILFVVAIGLTFVLLVGGFDLSIGSLLGLSGFVLAYCFNSLHLPILVAMAATVAFGAVVGGLSNGFLIGRLKLSFMVVTLGTMTLFSGLIKLVSGGTTVEINSAFLVDKFSFGKVAGIPIPVLGCALVFAIAAYVLRYTLFGRDVYAVGGNPTAARLSGINVSWTIVLVYAIAGGAAAFGGIVAASRTGSAGPTVGDAIMLQAAAAVLIGGTSLRGGSGTVLGTAIGVLFFGVLSNGLQMAGFGTEWQQIISGVIIAGAALADKIQRDGLASLALRLPLRSSVKV
jgi:ribose transport system permease protein